MIYSQVGVGLNDLDRLLVLIDYVDSVTSHTKLSSQVSDGTLSMPMRKNMDVRG